MRVVELKESDLSAVAAFIVEHSAASGGDIDLYHTHLCWLILSNPARTPGLPIGWALLDSRGEIQGTQLEVAQRFCQGKNTVTAVISNGSFASRNCRLTASWGLLFNEFRKMATSYPLLSTSANGASAPFFQRLGGRQIAGWSSEMVTVIHLKPVLRELVGRFCFRSARKKEGVETTTLNRNARLALRKDTICCFAQLPKHINTCRDIDTLRGVRDKEFIEWRYFSKPQRRPVVFKIAVVGGVDCAVAVVFFYKGITKVLRAAKIIDIFCEHLINIQDVVRRLKPLLYNVVDVIVWQPSEQALCRSLPFGTIQWKFSVSRAWSYDPKELTHAAEWVVTYADGDGGF